MVRIYDEDITTFNWGGIINLIPLKALIHKEDNGDYYLDLECGLEYVNYIVSGKIVVANTPQGEQAFRIRNVNKTLTKITARCWHVSYDTDFYLFAFNFVKYNETYSSMMSTLNSGFNIYPSSHSFTFSTDMSGSATIYDLKVSVFKVMQDIAEASGGHFVRNNFSFAINQSIGQDTGIIIEYGKNLKSLTCAESWDNVCTRIYATGKDGAFLSAPIDSQTQYTLKYTKHITFAQENINRNGYNTESDYQTALADDLRVQANAYQSAHATPELTYTLKGTLDAVSDIGDTIRVIDDRLGIDIATTILSFEYDAILEQYTDITFGNKAKNLRGLGNTVSQIGTQQAVGNVCGNYLVLHNDNSVTWSSGT